MNLRQENIGPVVSLKTNPVRSYYAPTAVEKNVEERNSRKLKMILKCNEMRERHPELKELFGESPSIHHDEEELIDILIGTHAIIEANLYFLYVDNSIEIFATVIKALLLKFSLDEKISPKMKLACEAFYGIAKETREDIIDYMYAPVYVDPNCTMISTEKSQRRFGYGAAGRSCKRPTGHIDKIVRALGRVLEACFEVSIASDIAMLVSAIQTCFEDTTGKEIRARISSGEPLNPLDLNEPKNIWLTGLNMLKRILENMLVKMRASAAAEKVRISSDMARLDRAIAAKVGAPISHGEKKTHVPKKNIEAVEEAPIVQKSTEPKITIAPAAERRIQSGSVSPTTKADISDFALEI